MLAFLFPRKYLFVLIVIFFYFALTLQAEPFLACIQNKTKRDKIGSVRRVLFIHYLSKIADWQSKSQFLKLFFNQRIFFRGLHVAGHGKILPGVSFSSSTQNNKFDWKWNPRESWNYFYFQTLCDSGKCCNFQVFCDPGKEHSAILPFCQGEEINRRHFDWIEHHPFRVIRIEPTSSLVHSACQMNQRVQQPNLRIMILCA